MMRVALNSIVRLLLLTIAAALAAQDLSRPGDQEVLVPAAGFSLAAGISRPAQTTGRRVPAVVLVGGSLAHDRNQVVAGIPIFSQIAGALSDAGFLVIRYDARGVGQSGGRPEASSLSDYADDVKVVLKYLANRKDVDRDRVAVAGYEEGGWIALLAARRDDHIAAVALLATGGTTGAELTLERQRNALDEMSISDAERRTKIELQLKIQQAVMSGSGWQDFPSDLRRQADVPWFQSLLTFDPAQVVPKVRQPILIIHGELDRQVPVHHAERLAALARPRKRPATTELVRVPGVNHLLVPATTGAAREFPELKDKKVSQPVTDALASWLKRTLGAGNSR